MSGNVEYTPRIHGVGTNKCTYPEWREQTSCSRKNSDEDESLLTSRLQSFVFWETPLLYFICTPLERNERCFEARCIRALGHGHSCERHLEYSLSLKIESTLRLQPICILHSDNFHKCFVLNHLLQFCNESIKFSKTRTKDIRFTYDLTPRFTCRWNETSYVSIQILVKIKVPNSLWAKRNNVLLINVSNLTVLRKRKRLFLLLKELHCKYVVRWNNFVVIRTSIIFVRFSAIMEWYEEVILNTRSFPVECRSSDLLWWVRKRKLIWQSTIWMGPRSMVGYNSDFITGKV